MILIVNTWLGYPYMLLLCMGLLQAIPRDQYEASAIDGASPLDNLLRITLPQLIKPLMPLLIACFAFNFNNFVLITLLTRGGPDIIGATTPAGTRSEEHTSELQTLMRTSSAVSCFKQKQQRVQPTTNTCN